jgi:hypothetical protein
MCFSLRREVGLHRGWNHGELNHSIESRSGGDGSEEKTATYHRKTDV